MDRQVIPSRSFFGEVAAQQGPAAAGGTSKLEDAFRLIRSVSLPSMRAVPARSPTPPLDRPGTGTGRGPSTSPAPLLAGRGIGGGAGGGAFMVAPAAPSPLAAFGLFGGGLRVSSPSLLSVPTHQPHQHRLPLSSEVHTDWRIIASVRVTSPWPLGVASAPCDVARATAAFASAGCVGRGCSAANAASAVGSGGPAPVVGPGGSGVCKGDAAEALLQSRLYWAHPDTALPSAVAALKGRQEPEVVAMFRDRVAAWVACLRSLHRSLLDGSLPWFYVCVRDTGGEGGGRKGGGLGGRCVCLWGGGR
jgi:hypothetical protein